MFKLWCEWGISSKLACSSKLVRPLPKKQTTFIARKCRWPEKKSPQNWSVKSPWPRLKWKLKSNLRQHSICIPNRSCHALNATGTQLAIFLGSMKLDRRWASHRSAFYGSLRFRAHTNYYQLRRLPPTTHNILCFDIIRSINPCTSIMLLI